MDEVMTLLRIMPYAWRIKVYLVTVTFPFFMGEGISAKSFKNTASTIRLISGQVAAVLPPQNDLKWKLIVRNICPRLKIAQSYHPIL